MRRIIRRHKGFYERIGEEIKVFEKAQKAQIRQNGNENHAFFLFLRRCIFNPDAKRKIQNGRKTDNGKEPPIPPTVEKIACREAEKHSGATFQQEVGRHKNGDKNAKNNAVENHSLLI
jgi:hypothetical protein